MMTRTMHAVVLLVASLQFGACAYDSGDDSAVAAVAPALGAADGVDQADRACQLVLRHVSRSFGSSGFELDCGDGTCTWVFAGSIDIANGALSSGDSVGVLYRSGQDDTWWEVAANPTEIRTPGFSRYQFRVSDHTFGPDTVSDESSLEFAPFLRRANGSRIFDHNLRVGDFDNTRLVSTSFVFDDYQTCAPAVGNLWFGPDWSQSTNGDLREGGYLVIRYALTRLSACRNTHNGHPAWDTQAYVRFVPSGQVASGSVRDFVSNMGVPTNETIERPFEVQIPTGTTSVEVWFHNFSGAGSTCESWDSNYGANYRFDVIPAADDPRCVGNERWTNIYGGGASCLDYQVSAQFAATNCELYLNALGDGYEGHYGIPFRWLEAYVQIGASAGEVLDVGMYTRYWNDKAGTSAERFSFGTEIEPGYWKTGFTYFYSSMSPSNAYSHTVQAVAFFADVRRPDGTIVRLWQSRGGANYSWDDAFAVPTTTKYIPYGSVRYAGQEATIFDAKRQCQ